MKFVKPLSTLLIISFLAEQFAFAAPGLSPKQINLFEKPVIHVKFPESIATIEDAWQSPPNASVGGQSDSRLRGNDKLVYLIQDAHTNDSGQINLAKTLDIILRTEDR